MVGLVLLWCCFGGDCWCWCYCLGCVLYWILGIGLGCCWGGFWWNGKGVLNGWVWFWKSWCFGLLLWWLVYCCGGLFLVLFSVVMFLGYCWVCCVWFVWVWNWRWWLDFYWIDFGIWSCLLVGWCVILLLVYWWRCVW